MHTRNEILIRAPEEDCLRAAADVERWPEILPHYRHVEFTRRDGPGTGRVEMSAVRGFGPLPWPVWWASEMVTDPDVGEVRYRHVAGITEGMDVVWRLEETGVDTATGSGWAEGAAPSTRVVVLHDWDGPGWPLISGFAARRVIGPHFIRVVAQRTLEGIGRWVEAGRTADGRARQ